MLYRAGRGKKLHGRRAHQRRGAPPSWRVGIGRSARGSHAARPLASLHSIAPGSAPRAARSARLRLRIVLLRTESSRSARLRLLAGGYRDLGFQASTVDSSSPHYCPRRKQWRRNRCHLSYGRRAALRSPTRRRPRRGRSRRQ